MSMITDINVIMTVVHKSHLTPSFESEFIQYLYMYPADQ